MNFTKYVKDKSSSKKVINFMGGISYEVSPLTTLKIVSSSCIFAEPKYYESTNLYTYNDNLKNDLICLSDFRGKDSSIVMENIIDKALDYDFKGTLEWAVELRNDYYMRLNPQVILVRAAMHKNRANFNKINPSLFKNIAKKIILRGDEPISGLTYYLFINKSKKCLPNILKKVWKSKINSLNEYELNSYKNSHIGMIDTIRICHAGGNEQVNKLMKKKFKASKKNQTWINQKSEGKKWLDILANKKMNHQALLRNLNGIFTEIDNRSVCEEVLGDLVNGVLKGKQFPFRYYQAYKVIDRSQVNNKTLILDKLEECIDVSIRNLPVLKGKTVCLSDNSGSAWGSFTSSYGKNVVAHINNLSSVISSMCSEEGLVIKFGDTVKAFNITKRNGALHQSNLISANEYFDVGGNTENGIWMFFKNAIDEKIHYDNIFIYSDQQAGHNNLYGLNRYDYMDFSAGLYIDIVKLIKYYRTKVNPYVNIFSIQTAGYDNLVIPEYLYRTYILSGWTGKEVIFADKVNKIANEIKINQRL